MSHLWQSRRRHWSRAADRHHATVSAVATSALLAIDVRFCSYMAECTTPAKRGRDIAVMLTNLIVGISENNFSLV